MKLHCNTKAPCVKRLIEQGDHFSKWDWALFVILAVFCFFSFSHGDIYLTGNRAWKLYESNIFNYYDVLYNWTHTDGATYMPTTFFMFAIWLLPLKLLGFIAPPRIREFRLLYGLWYKALPVLIYFISAYLIYRIALQIGMNKRRAKICMFSFITMPVAFFSQFIFSQYDIFTVFFMLLGLHYYLKDTSDNHTTKEHWLFCLFFGLALTCKYYAVLIFLVLLFVREKNIGKIILSVLVMILPFAIEFLMYAGSERFINAVFGFNALNYTSKNDFTTIIGGISFFKVACIFIIIWAYFTSPKDREDEIRWLLYLCCGICFALFGLMTWHPQWLLFAVPFWVLSAFIHKDTQKFYWGNILFCIAFYMFIFRSWSTSIDVSFLKSSVWKYMLEDTTVAKNVVDLVPLLDGNTCYSAIFAILLALFLFVHPKFTRDKLSDDDGKDHMWLIRLQLILAVIVYAVPTFYAFNHALNMDYVNIGSSSAKGYSAVTADCPVVQQISGIDGTLLSVEFQTATYARNNSSDLYIQVIEESTGNVISECVIDTSLVEDLKFYVADIPNVTLCSDEVYQIRIGSNTGSLDDCFAIAYTEDNEDGFVGIYNNSETEYDYRMLLTIEKG